MENNFIIVNSFEYIILAICISLIVLAAIIEPGIIP
jgi:hypothetical protein